MAIVQDPAHEMSIGGKLGLIDAMREAGAISDAEALELLEANLATFERASEAKLLP